MENKKQRESMVTYKEDACISDGFVILRDIDEEEKLFAIFHPDGTIDVVSNPQST